MIFFKSMYSKRNFLEIFLNNVFFLELESLMPGVNFLIKKFLTNAEIVKNFTCLKLLKFFLISVGRLIERQVLVEILIENNCLCNSR